MNDASSGAPRVGSTTNLAGLPAYVSTSPLDELNDCNRALEAVCDLLDGINSMEHVGRDGLAGLMTLLTEQMDKGNDLGIFAAAGFGAVADLLIPDHGLNTVNRERLSALLQLLLRMQVAACDKLLADAQHQRTAERMQRAAAPFVPAVMSAEEEARLDALCERKLGKFFRAGGKA